MEETRTSQRDDSAAFRRVPITHSEVPRASSAPRQRAASVAGRRAHNDDEDEEREQHDQDARLGEGGARPRRQRVALRAPDVVTRLPAPARRRRWPVDVLLGVELRTLRAATSACCMPAAREMTKLRARNAERSGGRSVARGRWTQRRSAAGGASRAFLKSFHAASQSGLPSPAARGATRQQAAAVAASGAPRQRNAPAANGATPRRENPGRRQRAAAGPSGSCGACGVAPSVAATHEQSHDATFAQRQAHERARSSTQRSCACMRRLRRTSAGRESGAEAAERAQQARQAEPGRASATLCAAARLCIAARRRRCCCCSRPRASHGLRRRGVSWTSPATRRRPRLGRAKQPALLALYRDLRDATRCA